MGARKAFADVLSALHDAALDDTLWPAASARVDEALGAMGNTMVVGEGPEDDVRVLFAASYSHGQRRHEVEWDYLTNYHPWDERVPRIRRLRDAELVHITDLYTAEELKTSRTYNEFSPRAHGRNSLNVRLDVARDTHVAWAISDPIKTGAWHADQLSMIDRLLPHVRHFVRVRQAMADARAMGSSLSAMLDNTRVGIIYLDYRGRIVQVNDRALEILRRRDGLFDEGGYLAAWLPADNDKLRNLLAGAMPSLSGQGAAGSVTINRSSNLPKLVVHVNPLSGGWLHLGSGRLAALALVVEPSRQMRLDAGLVGEALGLTPAESEIAVMLAEGRTVRDIAEGTGRKPGTVHDLIKRAHKRLGIARQVDLVRLVLDLADLPAPRD